MKKRIKKVEDLTFSPPRSEEENEKEEKKKEKKEKRKEEKKKEPEVDKEKKEVEEIEIVEKRKRDYPTKISPEPKEGALTLAAFKKSALIKKKSVPNVIYFPFFFFFF